MTEVRDLDVLKPEVHIVKLAGHEIDVSFIPTGLTVDIDRVAAKLRTLDVKKMKAGDVEETTRAFDLGIELCATFCSWQHKEMTDAWFRRNTSALQVEALSEEIRSALLRAYEGIDPN